MEISDDHHEIKEWDTELVIGPIWREIDQSSPVVAPALFYDYDNDDNDNQGWTLPNGSNWEESEVNQKKRIKLKFRIKQWGESSHSYGIVYHVSASGSVTDMESRNYLLGG